MKEIFSSILFLGIIAGLIWGGLHWKEKKDIQTDNRSSINTLSSEVIPVVASTNPASNSSTKISSSDTDTDKKQDDSSEKKTAQPETSAAKLNVKVLNGGGPKGSAGKLQEFLKKQGYTQTLLGNAEGDYTGVTVFYLDGNTENANGVKKTLSSEYSNIQVKAAAPKSEEAVASVVVIIGK